MLGGTSEGLGDAYFRVSVGNLLSEIRTIQGKTIQEISDNLNIPMQRMIECEKGRESLPTETLVRWLGCLNVLVPDFFRDVFAMERGERRVTCIAPASSSSVKLQLVRGG